jgi:hypothetical protein
MAAPSVNNTSRIDSLTTSVASQARRNFIPGGKRRESRSSSPSAARSTSSALAFESWVIPIPTASLPLNFRNEL